jgi:16S rRNA (cytidine1402-2'-O)-methyltransferase
MKKTSNHPSPGPKLKPLPGPGKSSPQGSTEHSAERSLEAGLYILATPIGNAQDISLRALSVLAACDLVLAEDTRVTAKLFAIHGIQKTLSPYNDHNAAEARPAILGKLQRGARIVLVSDAGTPLVSDPGFKLVRAAIAEGIPVTAIPGPSAALAALAVAGLPTDRFLFAGFLSAKAGERARALDELKGLRASLIFFESGPRLAETLAAMAEVLGPRDAVVARELTKLHEDVRRGTLNELAALYEKAGTPKGEITLVVGPPAEVAPDTAAIDAALKAALPFMPVKAAADMIAALTGAGRKSVYDRALDLKPGELKDE